QRSQEGKADALAVFGAITVGSISMNKSPVELSKFKPVARLTAEYLVLAVKADAPYQNLDDFVKALKADPGATAVGGGSAGGVDHIALALLAQDADIPVSSLNYIPQAGGADTVTGIVNGTLKAGISGISEFQQFAKSGRVKILGITSAERMKGLDAPTFKEAGYDVELANWRGILGSVDMPEENYKTWVERFTKLNDSDAWKQTMATQGWDQFFLAGPAFGSFIKEESDRINKILKDAGLAKYRNTRATRRNHGGSGGCDAWRPSVVAGHCRHYPGLCLPVRHNDPACDIAIRSDRPGYVCHHCRRWPAGAGHPAVAADSARRTLRSAGCGKRRRQPAHGQAGILYRACRHHRAGTDHGNAGPAHHGHGVVHAGGARIWLEQDRHRPAYRRHPGHGMLVSFFAPGSATGRFSTPGGLLNGYLRF